MKLPFFDESLASGSLWSTIISVSDSDPQMPQPTYIGERRVQDPDYRLSSIPKQKVDWSTLKVCLAGQGQVETPDGIHIVHPGQAILFCTEKHPFAHGIAAAADEFHFYRMTFTGLNHVVNRYVERYGHVFNLSDKPRQHPICKRLLAFKQDHVRHLSLAASQAAECTWSIMSAVMRILEQSAPSNSLSHRCVEWINSNVESQASIGDCAHALQVSQAHLTRVFSDSFQQTPGQFLLAARMRHAVHLLLNSTEPVKAIANRCGYRHGSHFCRAFKDFHGFTANEVRKNTSLWQSVV